MDSPRKNNDCYFYYYSTCLKGDGCMFRHEPAALGCETVCTFWQQGKCLNQRCNFRHMELRKNRKIIPCYWENQPGGCRKPHCSFQHKNPREPIGQDLEKNKECETVGAAKAQERADWPRRTVLAEGAQFDECVGSSDNDSGRVGPRRVSQGSEASYGSPPVDPLVVNFEEESDNESVPTSTPTKKPQKNVHVKTLEEIRLERVQAESAAFYSYNTENTAPGVTDLRSRIGTRKTYSKSSPDFRVLTLEEIRQSRATRGNSTEFSQPDTKRFRKGFTSNGIDPDDEEYEESGEHCTDHDDHNADKSLSNNNLESPTMEIKDEEKSSRKRSHSPIIFVGSSKKFAGIDGDEHKDSAVINKENEASSDGKDAMKESQQVAKRFRKPLRRGQLNDVANNKAQTARVIRLRRRNNVVNRGSMESLDAKEHSKMRVSSELPNNNLVSSEVPQSNVSLKSNSHSEVSCSADRKEGTTRGWVGNGTHDIEFSEDKPDTANVPNVVMEGDVEGSEIDVSKQSSMICDSTINEKLNLGNRIEEDDDELLLTGTESSVIYKTEDDILQHIDDMLNE